MSQRSRCDRARREPANVKGMKTMKTVPQNGHDFMSFMRFMFPGSQLVRLCQIADFWRI
jgi:hypothetical protein